MHRLYENNDITVFWDSEKCRHAKECVHGAPQAFDRNKRPWIDVNAASNPRLWRAISKCPSGALTCVYNHDIRVVFSEEENRSIAYDGEKEIGECCYEVSADAWTIVHTAVNPDYRGKDIAKRLVYKVVEAAEKRKLRVVPACSYAERLLGDI